jgi:hypothetical protein
MSDLITKAIEDDTYEQEREASGVVDGTQVTIRKKSYTTKAQREFWKVSVYLHGNDWASEQETQLSAEEAEERFNELVDKHSLGSPGDNVFKQLSEMDEVSDETIEKIKRIAQGSEPAKPEIGDVSDEPEDMWCRECATKAKYGPGIGHYCPNQDCEVADGPELVDSKSKTKDQDIGREVSAEDCEECGGTLEKTSSTVHAPGFADSFRAECVDCGHEQHVAAW